MQMGQFSQQFFPTTDANFFTFLPNTGASGANK
jgi:hypothetical protein